MIIINNLNYGYEKFRKAELARYVNRSEGYIGKAIYYGWKIAGFYADLKI
jgi:hypothetical protein